MSDENLPGEELPPENSNTYTNTGAAVHYIYSGDQFVTALQPGNSFGYFIEPGLDLRVSLTPPSEA